MPNPLLQATQPPVSKCHQTTIFLSFSTSPKMLCWSKLWQLNISLSAEARVLLHWFTKVPRWWTGSGRLITTFSFIYQMSTSAITSQHASSRHQSLSANCKCECSVSKWLVSLNSTALQQLSSDCCIGLE